MNLPERVAQSIGTRHLLSRGAKLLMAVSGGVDSMVLLHLLYALAPKFGWQLTVAHFNHQLRGRSSAADERLVRQTAAKLQLPFVTARANVRELARREKISIEMAARQLRHGFLAQTARRRKIPGIALAHHADDQVELFFLRLLRGSGGEGLAGMKWTSPSPANAKIKLVRPLLDVSKVDLETFARENEIRFREDASNQSLDFLRNRIRGELLPLLRRKYQPALDRTITRVMDIVGTEADFVSAAAERSPKAFAKLPLALQRRWLQQRLLALGITPEFDLIEQLRGETDAVIMLNPQTQIWRDVAGMVRIGSPADRRSPALPAAQKIDLRQSGEQVFGRAKIAWKLERQEGTRRPPPVTAREFFDADKVGRRIVLRHWRAGDRFQPIGMSATVKLQDLFVNAKIPRDRRQELIVATTAAGTIFWVEGLRIGEHFKLDAMTRRRLHWSWRR